MQDSVGRQRLKEWLEADPSRSQAKAARALGVKQPSIFAWLNGLYRPQFPQRKAIEALTGIPAQEWDSEEERQKQQETLHRIEAMGEPTGTDGH